MIDTLITSKTRIKLLLKFFLNGKTSTYLRNLETEFGESTNSIRIELNKFEQSGLLRTKNIGKRKYFEANREHPMYTDIRSILHKYTGLDKITEQIISQLGELEEVYLIGELARGLDSNEIELIFVGDIDSKYLSNLASKVGKLMHRSIQYHVFNKAEFNANRNEILNQSYLELWP